MAIEKLWPFLQRSARLLVTAVFVTAVFGNRPSLAQGPGWQLGEVDECQRKDIASEPQQHRWWKDDAPVELYEQVLMNRTFQEASKTDDSPDTSPHGPAHYRQQRVQLQRSSVTGPELWQMDQDTPAFDPAFNVVRMPRTTPHLPHPSRELHGGGESSPKDQLVRAHAMSQSFWGICTGSCWHLPDHLTNLSLTTVG